MQRSTSVTVSIDLQRVRNNALAILDQTRVPMLAVVKADAYGLGAVEIAKTIGDLVDGFYVFDAEEAVTARLWDIAGKRTVALRSSWTNPDDFLSHHIQPVVYDADRAAALCKARPVLSIDTGQQRFACPVEQASAVRAAGDCREVMTHAVQLSQAVRFEEVVNDLRTGDLAKADLFLHAAGSALLSEPVAWFNAVRPGLALYRGAVTVSAPLVEVRDSNGPAGYTRFVSPRFGIILAGYSQGLRKGPCKINGELHRVLEVGMQSAFVEISSLDQVGDRVMLLADEVQIDEAAVAEAWGSSAQEVLVRLTAAGVRSHW